MAIGLNHLHTNLAHLLVLCASVNLVLALLGGGRSAGVAAWVGRIHEYGIMMMGRLIYVAGLGLAMVAGYAIMQPWILAGLVLWGAVEVSGKRLVTSALTAVADGGVETKKLVLGAAVQLVVIVTIYACMQMKPSF